MQRFRDKDIREIDLRRVAFIVSRPTCCRCELALDRVPGMSKALDCDPGYLFQLALDQEFGSSVHVVVKQIFGTLPPAARWPWLEEIRTASDHTDPHLTAKAQGAIGSIFGK